MPLLPVPAVLSPWVLNIRLTMFTENCLVHRRFQARAWHCPWWLSSVLAVTLCALTSLLLLCVTVLLVKAFYISLSNVSTSPASPSFLN